MQSIPRTTGDKTMNIDEARRVKSLFFSGGKLEPGEYREACDVMQSQPFRTDDEVELRHADACSTCVNSDPSCASAYVQCTILKSYVGRHYICNEFKREETQT
jgi:hypothetical protein